MKQEQEEVLPVLYVEKTTRMIFEAKLFDEFIIVRPVFPSSGKDMRKMSHLRFAEDFDEYGGNARDVYDYLAGGMGNGLTLS